MRRWLLRLYHFQIPKNGTKVKLLDMNGKEYEKTVEETFPKYEMIGTHAGRRTFICFALSSGIPPQVVMKWTGHSDYQAMKLFNEELKK